MGRTERNCNAPIQIRKVVSVLPNDYGQLTNLPTVNGVSLIGELTAESLNLLSADGKEYAPVKLNDVAGKDMYLIAVGEGGPQKVPVDDFIGEKKGNGVQTTEKLDTEVVVGTIQFVLKN